LARSRASAAGFTLIELVVVIAVVALVAAMAVPALSAVTGADTRKAAGELAGSMRALFDSAALRHATCRLALDVEGRSFWAECAPGRAGLARDPARAPDAKTLEERFPGEKDAELRRVLAKSEFGKYEDRLVSKRELPGSVRFGPIHVEGRRDAVEAGVAYVHFFPGGQAQRAYVPVEDGKNVYTVVVEPFTGRARVTPGKVEVRE
jgi:general secretion pathway protein H